MFDIHIFLSRNITQIEPSTTCQNRICLQEWYVVIVVKVANQFGLLTLDVNVDLDNFAAIKIVEVYKQCVHLEYVNFVVSSIIRKTYFEKLLCFSLGSDSKNIDAFVNIENEQMRRMHSDILRKYMFIVERSYFSKNWSFIGW